MSEILSFAVAGWVVLAWLTHVVTCLKTASWGFLIAGAVFFPVGCVHGTGIWFGVF
jgi:predicted membrane channel-forming protein YqfA (hemolysin III family)